LGLYASYDLARGGYQFIEKLDWLPALGISYHVGVDGMSLPLVLLAGLVIISGVLVSWKVEDRLREFYSFLMFLGTSVMGVFCALDLFMLFFFFELAVFPKYLMIVVWGSPQTREYGGMKLTLYLFIGSVFALLGALAIYFGSGQGTFNMLALEQAGFSIEFQRLWFPFVFFGFAILGGIFPFHSWAPDGHVGRSNRDFHAIGRGGNESRRFCSPTGRHYAPAGWGSDLGAINSGVRNNQCRLWGIDRPDSDRFQVCHRVLVSFAHGFSINRFCGPQS